MPETPPWALTVSRHAMDRYRERVADLTDREIFDALTGSAFYLAVEIGAPFVKLPSGHHAVIREATVITILPPDCPRAQLAQSHSPRIPAP